MEKLNMTETTEEEVRESEEDKELNEEWAEAQEETISDEDERAF